MYSVVPPAIVGQLAYQYIRTYFVPYTLNMCTDLCILVLPVPVICNLQMTLKRRLTVIAVITTGGSAVLVSGLRAIIMFEFGSSPDFTWTLGEMVIISNVEMQVAIFAANMPSLKAFYTLWRKHQLGPGEGVEGGYSSGPKANTSRLQDGVKLPSRRNLSRANRGMDDKGQIAATLTTTEIVEELFDGHHHTTMEDKSDHGGSMRSKTSTVV